MLTRTEEIKSEMGSIRRSLAHIKDRLDELRSSYLAYDRLTVEGVILKNRLASLDMELALTDGRCNRVNSRLGSRSNRPNVASLEKMIRNMSADARADLYARLAMQSEKEDTCHS